MPLILCYLQPELNNATVIWSEIRGIMNHLSITCSLISSMKQLTNEVIFTIVKHKKKILP